jgi:shikimate kinase
MTKNNMTRIFLIGLPGSGKTTLGKQLATLMHYTFYDTDELIVDKEKKTIEDIFRDAGEDYFRNKEREVLDEVCLINNVVISTGGGLPCFYDHMNKMNDHGVTVFLKVSEEELLKRLMSAGNAHRPMVKGKSAEELKEFLKKKITERYPDYLKSKCVLDGDHLHAEDILSALNTQGGMKI